MEAEKDYKLYFSFILSPLPQDKDSDKYWGKGARKSWSLPLRSLQFSEVDNRAKYTNKGLITNCDKRLKKKKKTCLWMTSGIKVSGCQKGFLSQWNWGETEV